MMSPPTGGPLPKSAVGMIGIGELDYEAVYEGVYLTGNLC
jgi:hypothetical protein